MARLLLCRLTVVTTSRSAALIPLVLAGVVISAASATADSINLLRTARAGAPLILIDHSKGPWTSDDEATAIIDSECVAISGQARDRRRAVLGGVNWSAGQLAWHWDARAEPDIVYVICVDRAPRDGGFGGGLHLSAALSWSSQPGVAAVRRESFGAIGGTQPNPAFTEAPDLTETPWSSSEPPWTSTEPPWTSTEPPPSWPSDPPLDAPLDLPLGLPIPIGSISFPSAPTSDIFPGLGGNSTPPGGTFSPPIVLDPPEMIATPEPGTFLLMGTGLAAAWRMARRKRKD